MKWGFRIRFKENSSWQILPERFLQMETFAKRITKLRLKKGLTQKKVAKALGVPLSTYKEWEYGRRIQGEEVYVKLAEVLNVGLKTMLTGEIENNDKHLIQKMDAVLRQLADIRRSLLSA